MNTDTSRTLPDGLERLVTEGRYLKDHALRAIDLDAMPLTRALVPFDRERDYAKISDADVQALSRAFQETFKSAQATIEERTLNNVLAGRSPLLPSGSLASRTALICNNALLTITAILLVLGAFHFSTWISKSSRAIADADVFLAFDNTAEVNRLIELQDVFAQTETDENPISSPILQTYLEEAAALELQYFKEVELPARLQVQSRNVNPIHPIMRRFLDHTCVQSAIDYTFVQRVVFGCQPKVTLTDDGQILAEPSQTFGPETKRVNDFGAAMRAIEESRNNIMRSFGREPVGSYRETRFLMVAQMEVLRQQLSLIYLWALPVIYGALGSAVYSMWCMLNSNVSNHRALYFLIRMIFGSLAALTFSMLLVPSNLFVIGTDLNRPLVYLIAFIFGYSIETFINVLNQLNRYIAETASFGKKP